MLIMNVSNIKTCCNCKTSSKYLLDFKANVIFCANLCLPIVDQEVSKPGEQDAAGKSAGEAATESKVEATPST